MEEIEKVLESVKEKVDGYKANSEKHDTEINELKEKQAQIDKQVLELQQKSIKVDAPKERSTVGDSFVKSDSYQSFAKGNARSAAFVFKADTTPDPIGISTLAPKDRRPGVLAEPNQSLVIEGLIPHLPTSVTTVEYLKEGTFTNNAAFVAEAAQKPQSTDTFELMQSNVQTIAHFTKVTRQLIDDSATLAAFINARMVYGVNLKVEQQIINGNGTSPNLGGLMKDGNYTAQAFTYSDLGGDSGTLLDLLRLSIAKVNAANYRANAILLNPMDWAKLQGLKGSNDQYLYGVPSISFENMTAWGVRVVTSASMTEGKYLVGDFSQAATIYDRMSTVIDIASQNENDFIKNLFTIRAERRLALVVEHPKALVGGSLAMPTKPTGT